MGKKWQKDSKGQVKGGNRQQQKRPRKRDADSSDEEEQGNRNKKAKIEKKASGSFLTHGSQISDQILNIPKEDLTDLPEFHRCFWTGPSADSENLEDLKALRKSLGVLVKGPGADQCPAPVVAITSPGIPATFATVFTKGRLTKPTVVQMQAWPSLLSGNNLLCIAPTGSGKTLAYGLPMLPHIAHQKKNRPRGIGFPVRPMGLVLVPTRELALQVAAAFKPLKAVAAIHVVAIYGGQDKDLQLDHLGGVEGAPPADVIVATPGRLIDLMSTKHISLSAVTYLVVDEADRMLALGFEEQLNAIADHTRGDKQSALFSATFPGRLRNACDKWIGAAVTLRISTMEISNEYLVQREKDSKVAAVAPVGATDSTESTAEVSKKSQNPTSLASPPATVDDSVAVSTTTAPVVEGGEAADDTYGGLSSSLTLSRTVTQEVHVCVPHKKPRLLLRYILRIREKEKVEKMRQPGPMIIFCGKIKTINYLIKFLSTQDLKVEKFHGQLAQSAREKVLNDFKAGKINILVATDVAARGIHIKRLKYVVNYDFPNNLEQYCHRVGRAGRQGEIGYSYSFLTRNAAVIAKDLISLLRSCDQSIEPNLIQLEEDYRNGALPPSEGADAQSGDEDVGMDDDDEEEDEEL